MNYDYMFYKAIEDRRLRPSLGAILIMRKHKQTDRYFSTSVVTS